MTSRFVAPFFDTGSGLTPSDGSKLTFKNPGLETLKNTFSDAAGLTPNANPVIADATGLFSNIYIKGNYDVVLQDKNNVQIWADSVSEFALVTDGATVKNFATLALAVANTGLVDGDALNIAERTAGNAGGAMWDVVLSSTVTENTFNIVQAVGVGTLSLVLRIENGVANIKEFGATGDGVTDDAGAIAAAISFFTTPRGGAIYVPIGAYKYSVGLDLSENGLRLYGECWRNSILWYSGTATALTLSDVACEVDHIHLTSLDPATSDHLISINVGTGSAETGMLLKHVDAKIHNNTISYFNDSSVMAAAIKTAGNNCFSNSIYDNYIRFNWGGIEFSEVVTDMTVTDNTILDVEKYGVSLGFNWKTATQNTFIGDNYRIEGNLIQNVNKNFNPGGGVGDGYGIYLTTGAVISVEGNYIEDVVAQSGFTAYGVFGDGLTSGKLLQVVINKNNLVTNFGGTSFPVFMDNMDYGSSSGNHFEGGGSKFTLGTDARFFAIGSNFFTGSPASPYDFTGASNYALDLANGRVLGNSLLNIEADVKFKGKHIADNVAAAWVNFVGSTAVISDSFNVTSVTRNASGDYTINFTTNLQNAVYAVVGSARRAFVGVFNDAAGSKLVSTCRIDVIDTGGTLVDKNEISVAIFSNEAV